MSNAIHPGHAILRAIEPDEDKRRKLVVYFVNQIGEGGSWASITAGKVRGTLESRGYSLEKHRLSGVECAQIADFITSI